MTKLTPNRHLKNDYNPARATGKAFEHRMPILNPPHLRKKSEPTHGADDSTRNAKIAFRVKKPHLTSGSVGT